MTAQANIPPGIAGRWKSAEAMAGAFWRKIRRYVRAVPFAEEAVAAWYAARDPSTPAHVRAVLVGALAYFVVPVDMVPDFLAGLGFTDDAAVLMAALQTVRGHIRPAHRDQARAALADAARGVDDLGGSEAADLPPGHA